MTDRCPKCGAKGFRSGEFACESCGWKDPVLESWVPSGWYQDPANPNHARYWDRYVKRPGGLWRGKSRKDMSAQPIPTTPPPGWLEPTASVVGAPDVPAQFRTARVVALIAAIISGALTATHWYVHSISGVSGGESLWTTHPALGALVVAGAVLVAGSSAASLFRVPNNQPNLPTIVLGFAVVAALTMVVCSIIGLTSAPAADTEISEHVAASATSVIALLLALVAVGGTAVMFWEGREHMSEALEPSVTEPSEITVPESREPAAPTHVATPAAPTSAQVSGRDSDGDPVKRCPECAEWVKDAANVCRYCGFRFAS